MSFVRAIAACGLVIATTSSVRAAEIVLLCATPAGTDTQIVSIDANANKITVKRDRGSDVYMTRLYSANETNSDIRLAQKVSVDANIISYEDRFVRPDNSLAMILSYVIDRNTDILTLRRKWNGGESSSVYRCRTWQGPR